MQTHATARKASSHATQPFFSVQAARAPSFFSPSQSDLDVVQRKCAACEGEAKILPKLAVGSSHDPLEGEADLMADRVVRRRAADSPPAIHAVQRKCAACEQNAVQRKVDGDAASDTGDHTADSLQQGIAAQRGAGRSLDAALRQEMEQGIGADFSGVRIHTGAPAAQLNAMLQARAFTHGQDVFFNAGQFDPHSSAGRHLIAHELTHVVQQSGNQAPPIQRSCGAAAIGAPAGCSTHLPIFLDGYPTFKFKPNCDEFASGQEAALVAHAAGLSATAAFEVHGYSSAAGDATFNRNLSCARAQEARRALTDPPPGGAGVPAASISGVFAHGGTPGPAAARSSVVLTPARPTALPTAVPTPGATDFAINRVGTSTATRTFFEAGSSTLTVDAILAISAFKATSPGTVKVNGFISAEEPDSLAQDRADAVKAKLEASPDAVTVSAALGKPTSMKDTSNFVEARSVETVVGSTPPTKVDCRARVGGVLVNPPTQSCATMDAATDTAFTTAHPIAKDAMTEAVAAVTGTPDAVAEPLIDRFFGNHDAATLATLRTNLGKLQAKVNALPAITKCGGQCDGGGCDRPSTIAYHTPVGVSPTKMVLCVPNFRSLHPNDRPRNLIHETAHGTSPLGGGLGKGTKDLAYRHERMLFQLAPADLLRNSDSYALFAMFIREARSTGVATATPAGIDKPASDSMPGVSSTEKPVLELALAQLEKRLGWCDQDMSQVYGQVNEIHNGTLSWAAAWSETYIKQAAKRFPLTPPRGTPTITDLARIAGIVDRYMRMHAAMQQDLTVTKAASGGVNWPASSAVIPGASLSVGPDFFRAVLRDQVALLLEALARATSDVEPAFVPAYVTLAEWIHSQNK